MQLAFVSSGQIPWPRRAPPPPMFLGLLLCLALACRWTTDTDSVRPPASPADAAVIACSETSPCPDGYFCDALVCVPYSVTDVALGAEHTCALFADGRVKCWGLNDHGQLGYGDFNRRGNTPDSLPRDLPAVALGRPATAIAAGGEQTCAILDDASVWCWGDNCGDETLPCRGILGLGDTRDSSSTPQGPIELGGTVTALAMGRYSSCAQLSTDAQLRCWGDNDRGQLGIGNRDTIGDTEVPGSVPAVELTGPIRNVAVGNYHVCATLEDGDVYCWGEGTQGRLGYENQNDLQVPPTTPVYLGGAVDKVAAGTASSCAVLGSGEVRCWGANIDGRLGIGVPGNVGDDESPGDLSPLPLGDLVTDVSCGIRIACVVLAGGGVRCWGDTDFGSLGVPGLAQEAIGDDELPSAIPELMLLRDGESVSRIRTGESHTCAVIARDGPSLLRCWGRGRAGRLGTGNTENIGDDEDPVEVNVPIY